MAGMYKKLVLAILLILFFAEWQIDFAIGIADTALLVLLSLGTIIISFASATSFLVFKRKNQAVTSAVICVSVILGTITGLKVTNQQFQNAKAYVERLSKELRAIKKKEGEYPENLKALENFDPSGKVPIGIFRKRPLHYEVRGSNEGFRLRFPYKAFVVAEYIGSQKKWSVHD
ncbi:MAG TPA: hypothetical protein VKO20_04660 [Desulfosalsimonadaceae bacterium]|nr:hypothetical protein [Desulfosalsimonadaceae bacterium]